MKNIQEEFQVRKHDIGYLGSDFLPRLGHLPLEEKTVGSFQKLPRYMKDSEIISEMKPGECSLGDVLAFLKKAPKECFDGNWNLFYIAETAFVVGVCWFAGFGRWCVRAWDRGSAWDADFRVFSPATGSSKPSELGSSTLEPLGKNYRVDFECCNCGFGKKTIESMDIPLGKALSSSLCPNCQCIGTLSNK